MWTTSDGHELGIPQSRLASITSQMRKPEMKNLVRKNYPGNLKDAVVRSVGQLARNAHRTGNLRHRKSNRRYPVFRAGLNGRAYEIITSPVGNAQNAILSVTAEPDFELQELGTITRWTTHAETGIRVPNPHGFRRVRSLDDLRSVTMGKGLYIIKIPDIPHPLRRTDNANRYVGRSIEGQRGGIKGRLQSHRRCVLNMGIKPERYEVYVWEITRKGAFASIEERVKSLETQILARNNVRRLGSSLTNDREIEELWGDDWGKPPLEREANLPPEWEVHSYELPSDPTLRNLEEALMAIRLAQHGLEHQPFNDDTRIAIRAEIQKASGALDRIPRPHFDATSVQNDLRQAIYLIDRWVESPTLSPALGVFIERALQSTRAAVNERRASLEIDPLEDESELAFESGESDDILRNIEDAITSITEHKNRMSALTDTNAALRASEGIRSRTMYLGDLKAQLAKAQNSLRDAGRVGTTPTHYQTLMARAYQALNHAKKIRNHMLGR